MIAMLDICRVGQSNTNVPQDIQLSGTCIQVEHCMFENKDGTIKLIPFDGSTCYVNGKQISEAHTLKTGKMEKGMKFHFITCDI